MTPRITRPTFRSPRKKRDSGSEENSDKGISSVERMVMTTQLQDWALSDTKERAEEALVGYKVDVDGCICDFGQFEGEASYVPYFWNVFLDGCHNDDDGDVITVNVEASDVVVFPELNGRKYVRLYQSDDGFISEVG